MSDTPEARPGAPRPVRPAVGSAPNLVRPGKPVPAAAPTPRKPLPSVTEADEVQLASSSLMPVAEEVKAPPPAPAPTARRPAPESLPVLPPKPASSAEVVTSAAPLPPPPAATAELGEAAREQIAAILHTVLESTLAPAIAKQKELEGRLDALQRAANPRSSQSGLAAVRAMSPSVDITGSLGSGSGVPGPRPSMISTSYGLVSVMPGPTARPAIEEALEKVGPIEVPDFAGKRKFAGAIVIGILILAVVGAILATILSYS